MKKWRTFTTYFCDWFSNIFFKWLPNSYKESDPCGQWWIYTLFIKKILMRFSSSIYAFKKLTFLPSCLNFWTSSFLYWRLYRDWGQPRSNAFAVTCPVHYKIYLLSMEDHEQVAENLRLWLWDHGCLVGEGPIIAPHILGWSQKKALKTLL